MSDETDHVEVHGRDGALEALREVAADPSFASEFSVAVASFRPEDYEQLIALAWRFQFETDRARFKRELRLLEEGVSARILARLELEE